MNIQDESFPHEELKFSLNRYATQKVIAATITPPPTNANTSASSSSSSSDEQILSTESMTRRSPSEVSAKTASSDPIGLAVQVQNVNGEKFVEGFQSNRQPKSISYHDIHNKYTMRRYRHVESKVGQYIANIRAEEQKRRAQFQRHKSMPTSLTNTSIVQHQPDHPQHQQQEQTSLRHSTTDLYVLGDGSSTTSRYESSDDALNGADFIDKLTYAQLVDEKEYIEMKLKEKSSENFRLRRNVDYLRIELTSCQDKLKRLSSSNLSNFSSVMGYSYCGSGISVDAFGRCMQHPATETRATQTDYPAFVLRTPIPASLKATCNVLRQRTNSNSSAQKLKADSMRMKYVNSSDCDFGSSEMRSRKPKSCKMLSESFSSSDATPKSSPSLPSTSRSPALCRKTRQSTQNNFPATRYAALTMLNDSGISNIELEDNVAGQTAVFISSASNHAIKRQSRQTSLSQRFKRLILRCTRCVDTNNTAESYSEGIQMTQSPARLLNRDV